MSISELKHVSKRVAEPVHRLEIFTGSGRRRLWTADDKAAIVAESYAGSSVCAVAWHHGLLPQQLFAWRRAGRFAVETPPVFVPAIVEPPDHAKTKGPPTHRRKGRQPRADSGIIEVEIDGVLVRVCRGAEAKTVAAVLRALKGAL